MKFKPLFPVVLIFIVAFLSFGQTEDLPVNVTSKVHIFYYGWYANPKFDGGYQHWNHPIVPHWIDTTWNNLGSYSGGEDIGSNYYPFLGCYSSNDPEVISKHMAWMKEAGVGVVAVSWWGKASVSDNTVMTFLDIAQQNGLKITFHIEPIYKTIGQFKEHLEYLLTYYLSHPAVFRYNGKPLYYIYDSGKLKYPEWHKLLSKEGESSIRNTKLDAIFIGHWEREHDGGFIVQSGFDGFYTYYGNEDFMFGSNSTNWSALSAFAHENNLLFIPCPAPGYVDTRIRPWNSRCTKDRNNGSYYEHMFVNAINADPDFIAITSFNEWHEGTQIEPAVKKSIPDFNYEDYGTDPFFYIKKTRALVERYLQRCKKE